MTTLDKTLIAGLIVTLIIVGAIELSKLDKKPKSQSQESKEFDALANSLFANDFDRAIAKYYRERKFLNSKCPKKNFWVYPNDVRRYEQITERIEFFSRKGKVSLIWNYEDYLLLCASTNSNIRKYGENHSKRFNQFFDTERAKSEARADARAKGVQE